MNLSHNLPWRYRCSLPTTIFRCRRTPFSTSPKLLADSNRKDKPIPSNDSNATNNPNKPPKEPEKKRHQTISEADEELRRRLEQMSGGGGEAGIEYEDGKPAAMKRSVRENMFRLI
ncbi:hypothetical protein MAP00_000701 [Monascus purpureus]|nr:hypothetical protein MAP00_000701 [Monascus purpureus]